MHKISNKLLHTEEFYLSAGECGPERRLAIPLLTGQLIECATHHSNLCGAGYNDLIAHGQAWVLSRFAVEMTGDYPMINETYSISTWVEGLNRLCSERNFEIRDCRDRVVGYARSMWVAIDIERRAVVDISRLTALSDVILDRPCPIAKSVRSRPVEQPTSADMYRFRYCDLDFNRHVNTVRYIELLLDQWPLEFHDSHAIRRIDISFLREAHCGDMSRVVVAYDDSTMTAQADVLVDGQVSCHACLEFLESEYNK